MTKAPLKKKYIVLKRCQARGDDGKIRFYSVGKIAFFAGTPSKDCFMLADNAKAAGIDFNVVPEEVLLDDSIVPVEQIAEYVLTRFGDDYTGFTRSEVVAALISLRNAPPEMLSASDSKVPTAAEFKNANSQNTESGISVEVSGDTPADLSDGVNDIDAIMSDENKEADAEGVDDLDDLLG